MSLEEPAVDTVTVRLRVDERSRADCELSLGEEPRGTCPFEDGDGAWLDPGRLTFVVSGEPEQPFELEVQGLQGDVVLTSTSAEVVLPSGAGARGRLPLALWSRTRARATCSIELSDGPGPGERIVSEGQHTALAVVAPRSSGAGAPQAVLVSSAHALAQVDYRRTDTGCALEEHLLVPASTASSPNVASRWCNLRGDSMVARAILGDDRAMAAAGVCVLGGPSGVGSRLKLVRIEDDRSATVGTATLAAASGEVSNPVLADTDGDGTLELAVVLQADESGRPALFRAWFEAGRLRTRRTPLYDLMLAPRSPPEAPIVLPPSPNGSEGLLFFGRSSKLNIFMDGRQVAHDAGMSEDRLFTSQRPPAAFWTEDTRIGLVLAPAANRLAWARFRFAGNRWAPEGSGSVNLSTALSRSDAPIVIGRTGPEKTLEAVVVEAGDAQFLALEQREPTLRVVSSVVSGAAGAQRALMANLDGTPGAELLAYDIGGASVSGVLATSGEPLDGWPLALPAPGADRRLLVADLDGAPPAGGLRDLEVVSLSSKQLSVTALGLGTYDLDGTDWPVLRGDLHGSGVWRGSRDPTRPVAEAPD